MRAFLTAHGLRTDGPDIFLYHHAARPEAGEPIDFGVEVTRRFNREGEVDCVETPAGEAAILIHRGAYSELDDAHAEMRAWLGANGRTVGAHSLEIYGIHAADPAKLETTLQYLVG